MDVITELVNGARIVLCVEPSAEGYGWHIKVQRDDGTLEVIAGPPVSYSTEPAAVRVGVFSLVQIARGYRREGSGVQSRRSVQ